MAVTQHFGCPLPPQRSRGRSKAIYQEIKVILRHCNDLQGAFFWKRQKLTEEENRRQEEKSSERVKGGGLVGKRKGDAEE